MVTTTNATESQAHYEWRNTHTYVDQNSNGSEVSFYTLGPLGYTTNVYVKGTNTCGSSSEYYELLTVRNCTAIPPAPPPSPPGGPISVKPIPADTYIEVTFDETGLAEEGLMIADNSYDIGKGSYYRIVDKHGTIKLTQIYSGEKQTQINTSNLTTGLYTLQLVTSDKVYSTNIMVSR